MFELAVHEVSKIAFACLVLLRPRYLLGLHIPPSSQPQSWRMALGWSLNQGFLPYARYAADWYAMKSSLLHDQNFLDLKGVLLLASMISTKIYALPLGQSS